MHTRIFAFVHVLMLLTCFVMADEPTQTKPASDASKELETKILVWIDNLCSDDYEVEEEARWRLYKHREQSASILANKLREQDYNFYVEGDDSKEEHCKKYCEMLGIMGKAAHPEVREMLKDEKLYIRVFGMQILVENRMVPADFTKPILNTLDYDFTMVFEEEYFDVDMLDFVEDNICEALYEVRYEGLKHLIEALKDKNKYIRYAASYMFSNLKYTVERKKIALLPLLDVLKDNYNFVRMNALNALGELGDSSAVKQILPFMIDSNDDFKERAGYALDKLDCKTILPDLIKLLEHEDWHVRKNTAMILDNAEYASAVPALIKRLNDDDNDVRNAVKWTLSRIADKTIIPQVRKLMEEDDSYDNTVVVELLIHFEDSAILPLILKYADWERDYRLILSEALIKFGDKTHLPILLKLTKDEVEYVRENAFLALGGIKDNSEEVIKVLNEGIIGENGVIRYAAMQSIKKLNDSTFLPELKSMLLNKSKYKDSRNLSKTRWCALETIVQLEGVKSLEFLKKLLDDYIFNDTPGKIIELVRRFDDKTRTEDNPAVDFYIEAIENGSRAFVSAAVSAIGKRKSERILNTLSNVLTLSKNSFKRKEAADQLMDYADKSTLPALLSGLNDSEADVREICVEAIAKIGDKTKVNNLIPLLKDKDIYVKKEAILAISKLDGKNQYKHFIPLLNDDDDVFDELKDQVRDRVVEFAEKPEEEFEQYFNESENICGKLYIAAYLFQLNNKGRKKYLDFIVKNLENDDAKIQNAALKSIAKTKDNSVVPTLLRFLEKGKSQIFIYTVKALVAIKDKTATPKLIDLYENSYDSWVRYIVIEGLGNMGDKSAFETLVKAMQEDLDGWQVRSAAAEALGNLGDKRAVPYLIEALGDVFGLSGHIMLSVKQKAIVALGKLRAKEALPKLKELAEQYKSSVGKPALSCYDVSPASLYYDVIEAIKLIEESE